MRGFVARNQSCEFVAVVRQALESSDSPMLNAFCRVALSDRFNFLGYSCHWSFLTRQRLELTNLN
jgi:hypothetical protein